ncbi:MAG: hypothetical protein PHP22_07825 [Oscillospiraceae bacterium]|nr:hypothetical protein [Oscillospiraceae bacterium]
MKTNLHSGKIVCFRSFPLLTSRLNDQAIFAPGMYSRLPGSRLFASHRKAGHTLYHLQILITHEFIHDAHTITQKPSISKLFAHTINGQVQDIVLFYPLPRKTMKSGIVVNIPHRQSIRPVIMDKNNS